MKRDDAILYVWIAGLLTILVGMAILDPSLVYTAFMGVR